MLGTAAFAATPNRTTMSFEEFLNASGCVLVDKGGYQNIASVDGGNCPASVVSEFNGVGTVRTPGADGVLGTSDDGWKSDNCGETGEGTRSPHVCGQGQPALRSQPNTFPRSLRTLWKKSSSPSTSRTTRTS